MTQTYDRDEVQKAFETIKQAMQADAPEEPGSYAHSWHCNIAMMCHDAIVDADLELDREGQRIDPHKTGNDAASRFMKLCFDVNTKA
jgi:hypothetical protein